VLAPLNAPDDQQPRAQRRCNLIERSVGCPDRLQHAASIDDAKAAEASQIVGDGLGDTRG